MLDPALRRALAYVTPYWRRLGLVLGLSLLGTALSLFVPLLSRDLVDVALLGRDAAALRRFVLLFASITLAGFVLNVTSGLLYTRVSAEILFDMRLTLYRHLQRLSPRFYARTRLGDIVSRINNDIGEIQRVAAETALAWVGNVLFLVGTTAILIWLDLRLFLVGATLLPASVWALTHYRRKLEGRVAVLRDRSADIGSFLIETIQGVKLVVASRAEAREVSRFRDRNDRFIHALMAMQRVTYLSGGLPGLILSGGTVLVFLYGGQRVIAGTLSLGTLVAFMAYQMRLLAPVQALMGLYANVATVRVSLARIHEILDVAPEVADAEGVIAYPEAEGAVRFEGVSLSFDRGAPTLDDVGFAVEPGQLLAIVGPSGGGKSTVADLILRLLDPDRGRVLLDGRDLSTLRLDDIRRHVALVDQEPFVFHASLADNIRYARPDSTDAEVAEAAEAAGLARFIARLPEGYDTTVGERGAALSAGERQRVALARAFLVRPTVLVLDEPTAALDPITERQVRHGYEAIMRGRTTIVISHRAELAARADHVVVLEDARVVEQGPPTELRNHGGRFADLFLGGTPSSESPPLAATHEPTPFGAHD